MGADKSLGCTMPVVLGRLGTLSRAKSFHDVFRHIIKRIQTVDFSHLGVGFSSLGSKHLIIRSQ